MIWIENGIRNKGSTVKVGHMIPPRAAISEQSRRGQTLRMIKGQIRHYLLGPRQRRMIHRMITPCGKGGIAINIGSKLPHQEINGDLDYVLKQRCQVWLETLRMPALRFID